MSGLGADATVDYAEAGWPERVREATGGRGVDVVLEMSGGDVAQACLELVAPFGRVGVYGTFGLQWQEADLLAEGEEAFIPDSRTQTLGVFLFEKRDFETASVEFGLRWDRQQVDGAGLAGYDDSALNASLGGLWRFTEALALVGQVVRSERHPSSTEL